MTLNPLNLSIKSLKNWSTHDGGGYQYTLLMGGEPVAFVHNDGNGGPLDIQPLPAHGRAPIDAIEAHVKTLPPIDCSDMGWKGTIPHSIEIYLDDILGEYEFDRKLARAKKTKVCFRLPGDDEFSFRTMNTADLSKALPYLTAKFADKFTVL